MSWNYDMAAAPLGKTKTVERKIGDKIKTVLEHHVSPVWLATKSGTVHRSYWIPKNGQDGNRWAGFSVGSDEPIAWMDFIVPQHPFELGAEAA